MVAGGAEDYALTLPVILELGRTISQAVLKSKTKGSQNLVEELIPKMRQALYQDLESAIPGFTSVPTLPLWMQMNTLFY